MPMNRQLTSWFSPSVNKEMPIAVYGHYGFVLLLIPTAAADYLEYERFQLIDSIAPFIESGKVKVFSINSLNNESWMNNEMLPEHKGIRHNQFNQYIFEEVIPFIKNSTSPETPIITCGASFGALHSMNLFLRSEEHTSELQSHVNLVCRLLLEKKKKKQWVIGGVAGEPKVGSQARSRLRRRGFRDSHKDVGSTRAGQGALCVW